ncbi:MAG: MurR/RpiR family transcriptional regulator [Granulosicoccaceae bacterium]
MPLNHRLVEQFDSLSPQLQNAAKYVSDNPEQVATESMRKVAKASNISPPTFTRLAKALGLEGFNELKELCRQTLQERHSTFADKAKALQKYQAGGPLADKGTFVIAQAAATIDNIQSMVDKLDLPQLTAACDTLVNAENVYVLGGLSSQFFADYFNYMGAMAFRSWHTLDLVRQSIGASTARITPKDCLVVISMHPYSKEVVKVANRCAENGVDVIALSDQELSPIGKTAKYHFTASTHSPQFFASYTASLVLLEAMMGMVVRRGGAQSQRHIENVEKLNQENDTYW